MSDMVHANTEAADSAFASLFGRQADVTAEAPGRVNLMGDHTDYNGGYVLPTPLPQTSSVEVASRPDRKVRVWSANVEPQQAGKEFSVGQERRAGGWVDYVQAVTASLLAEGRPVTGMDMRISSDVPLGAGLSSSASLLIALFRAISRLSRAPLEDDDIARLAHLAETEFVGAPVGIMDQMVCALGRPGSAFFLDVADRQYEHVPLPQAIEWLVIHSGVHHSHATGTYQDRRRECETASALLGVHWLRDLQGVDPSNLEPKIEALPSPLARRVRHVVSENARVLTVKRRLIEGDLPGIGSEMNASHESLRRDFEVSVPETDLLVALAQADQAVYGARLTGGGFGGSIVIAAQAGTGQRVARDVVQAYRLQSKREGTVLLPPSPV